MTDETKITNYSVAYYYGDRKTGAIAVVSNQAGTNAVEHLTVEPGTDAEKALKPIFLGLTEDKRVVLLDPKTKELEFRAAFPADAFAAHIYADPTSSRAWFMNDGDKETGNDTMNCGDNGSSVTVIENASHSSAKYLKTICVGRGHHQATFIYPSDHAPGVPHRAYISNLVDGTLSAIGNDPDDAETFLKVVGTVNLCEADKEEAGVDTVPNKAFPHGLAYSPLSGKLYNLNNGYGTVAVIDPATNAIEERIAFKGLSNLFTVPGGRYIIGRGADRKTDANHVIAKLAVLDTADNTVADQLDLPDVYISKYFFNTSGTKLYLTTSASGSPEQKANLKTDSLLIFDLTALPRLKLVEELRLGTPTGTLAFRPRLDGADELVFASNSEDGVLTVISGQDDAVVEKISIGASGPHSRIWMLGSV